MTEDLKVQLEQIALNVIFWYNKQCVYTKHYLHTLYKSNNAFRIVYDIFAIAYTCIQNVFSFLVYCLFYANLHPSGTWVSIVCARKDADSNPELLMYYTTFGKLINVKSNYDRLVEYVDYIMRFFTKMFMGMEYSSSSYIYMDMNCQTYDIPQDSDTSVLSSIEDTYDNEYFTYSVSNKVLSSLVFDHIVSERNNYKELHDIYAEHKYIRKHNVVHVVNRDGTKYDLLDTMYVNQKEKKQRYSPLTQSMVIAHKNGQYEFRIVHWLTDVPYEPTTFSQSLVEFFEVEYHHPDMDEPIQIQLPESMMMVNNELYSYVFMCWYLKQLPGYMKYVFDDKYTIHLVDERINIVVLRSNQYIKLGQNSYEVMTGVLM